MSSVHKNWLCCSCQQDIRQLQEFAFMLNDALWHRAVRRLQHKSAPGAVSMFGLMCVGCIEQSLGRRLEPADFRNVPLTRDPNFERSPRLKERIGT